jgi:hyperosmotically inducible protein
VWSKALPAVLLLSFGGIALAAVPKQTSALSDEVRHGLLMLPYDNVFEELAFTIDGSNNVTLSGQVTCSIVKSDAESAVRNISRVGRVIDNIEVLPLPTFDGSIRIAACRAIFTRPGFEKHAKQVNSPIRIIVKNGHVTLEGIVANSSDKQMAEISAQLVPGVFSVMDHLTVW